MYYEAQWEQGRCQSLAYGHTMLLTLQISSPRNLSLYVAAVYTPSCTFMSMNVTFDTASVYVPSCGVKPVRVTL